MSNKQRLDSPAVRRRMAELNARKRVKQITEAVASNNTGWAFKIRACAALAALRINSLELEALKAAQQLDVDAVENKDDPQQVYNAWFKWQQPIMSADALVMHAATALRGALERVHQRRYAEESELAIAGLLASAHS